jgi:TM2 domain-containing membrane protein YozV
MRSALSSTLASLLTLASAIALGNPARAAGLDPQTALDRARVAYERGSYSEAIDTIHPLLYPSVELRSEDAVVEAHRILALSYFFLTRVSEAEQEANALLALRPNWEPDPIVDPQAAVQFFHAVRKKQDERLREIRERQKEEERSARELEEKRKREARAKAIVIERTVERHSRAIAFVPFGVGQFYNRKVGAGVAFLVTEVLLAGAWIGITAAFDQRYPTHRIPFADQDTAKILLGLQVGSAAAFWAVVAAGIIEAQVRFVPEFVHGVRQIEGPPSKSNPLKKTSLTPLVAPGLYGFGVGGEF